MSHNLFIFRSLFFHLNPFFVGFELVILWSLSFFFLGYGLRWSFVYDRIILLNQIEPILKRMNPNMAIATQPQLASIISSVIAYASYLMVLGTFLFDVRRLAYRFLSWFMCGFIILRTNSSNLWIFPMLGLSKIQQFNLFIWFIPYLNLSKKKKLLRN